MATRDKSDKKKSGQLRRGESRQCPLLQQSDAGRRFAIELFGLDETSAAYIQARFEAIRGRTTGRAGTVEHGRRLVDATQHQLQPYV